MVYKKRLADSLLLTKLKTSGIVVIEGAKWCGKTTTAEQIAKSVVYINDPSNKQNYQEILELKPQIILQGDTPRLIDEWQDAPKLWDAARYEADHRDSMGQFIFTGSAVPGKLESTDIRHSGTGRYSWMTMRPMSLWESCDSDGQVSLAELFNGTAISASAICEKSLDEIAYLICRGGWPAIFKTSKEEALELPYNYIDAVIKRDMTRVDGIKRDVNTTKRLLKSLARNQASQASISTIKNDIVSSDKSSISDDTIASYINALKKIFVVEDMEAWNPNLRSKTAIRTSDTRFFTDSSIAVASLGLGPSDLVNDLNTMGLLFETMCVRDLRVYADVLKGSVYHYRDKSNLECDAVVHLRDGRYGLIEIKLGGETLINEGVKNLLKLSNNIDTSKMNTPSFLMVLTGVGKYAYKRASDGVYIVPIGCLKD